MATMTGGGSGFRRLQFLGAFVARRGFCLGEIAGRVGEFHADQFAHTLLFHGHPVEHVGARDGALVVRDDQELALLDKAIASVDKLRSSLGAVQNRLSSAVTNLNNTTTNLSSAQSRIQDADYATEVSNMSKAQIVQQAGNSVLSKANQVPQQVLSLLQG